MTDFNVLKLKYSWFTILCYFQVYSSDSDIYIYICYICYIYIFFQILFHYRLWQDIEYNSLCSTVGSCCLSVLYIVVLSVNPILLIYRPAPFPFGNHKSVFSVTVLFSMTAFKNPKMSFEKMSNYKGRQSFTPQQYTSAKVVKHQAYCPLALPSTELRDGNEPQRPCA